MSRRGGRQLSRLASLAVAFALALVLPLAEAQADGVTCVRDEAVPECVQVRAIGQALGSEYCRYTRSFYKCLQDKGCYFLPDGCLDSQEVPVSCSELCEAEPGFEYCIDNQIRDNPADDYHLCPHVPKSSFTTMPPTEDEVLAAPSIPLTITVWTSMDTTDGSAQPGIVLPALWPDAVRDSLGQLLGIHPSTVRLEEPVSFRDYRIKLPDGPDAPVWAGQTTFMYMDIYILLSETLEEKRAEIASKLIGSAATHLGAVADDMVIRLNSAMPTNARLAVARARMEAIFGRADEFPMLTTTTVLTTSTTTLDPALALKPYRAWRVRCAQTVVYRWEILELELWADACPWLGGVQKLTIGASAERFLSPISSGQLSQTVSVAQNAFDGNHRGDGGSWVSSCQGCAPDEAWLGLDAGFGGVPFTAACAVIYQAESPTNQCPYITLDSLSEANQWEERDYVEGFVGMQRLCIRRTRFDYPLLQCGFLDDGCAGTITFGNDGDCPGVRQECIDNRCICPSRFSRDDAQFVGWECGRADDGCGVAIDFGNCSSRGGTCSDHVCKDDERLATQWRIVCEAGTSGRWWVREIEFHTDGLCMEPYKSYAGTLTSGSYDTTHHAAKAFDFDRSTFWGSSCNRCKPNEAWIGLDLGAPVSVACVRLIQADQTMNQCQRITLQYSADSIVWIQQAQYGFGTHTLRAEEDLTANMDVEIVDELELSVSEFYARYWRVSCIEPELRRQWGVFELNFYDDDQCINGLDGAIADILHSRSGSWPPSNAFDQVESTVWKSSCGRCSDPDIECQPCEEGEAYLGVRFEKMVTVQCVRIIQLDQEVGGCSSLALAFSQTGGRGTWRRKQTYNGIGTYAFMIAPEAGARRRAELAAAALCLALVAALVGAA